MCDDGGGGSSEEETQHCDKGAGGGGDISRSSCTGDGETTISNPSISAATATETGASSLALVPGTELADRSPEDCLKRNDHKSNPEQPVRWWLEIVGAGEVSVAMAPCPPQKPQFCSVLLPVCAYPVLYDCGSPRSPTILIS